MANFEVIRVMASSGALILFSVVSAENKDKSITDLVFLWEVIPQQPIKWDLTQQRAGYLQKHRLCAVLKEVDLIISPQSNSFTLSSLL